MASDEARPDISGLREQILANAKIYLRKTTSFTVQERNDIEVVVTYNGFTRYIATVVQGESSQAILGIKNGLDANGGSTPLEALEKLLHESARMLWKV